VCRDSGVKKQSKRVIQERFCLWGVSKKLCCERGRGRGMIFSIVPTETFAGERGAVEGKTEELNKRRGNVENDAAMAPLTSLNFKSRKGGQDWQTDSNFGPSRYSISIAFPFYSVPPLCLHRIVAGARVTERQSEQTNHTYQTTQAMPTVVVTKRCYRIPTPS
jgi:hypothetical protein